MGTNYLYSDYLFLGNGELIKKAFLAYDDSGIILDFGKADGTKKKQGKYYKGGICPGFINTHCHLELSALKSEIKEKTGLITFIKELQKKRNKDETFQRDAIKDADCIMWKEGIQAVGDISNSDISFEAKSKSKIRYLNFIELFGFDSSKAEEIYKRGLKLKQKSKALNIEASLVPHSPYSVSKKLMELIFSDNEGLPKSIHNQESEEENRMYQKGEGSFIEMLNSFNIDTSSFIPTKKSSLKSYLSLVPEQSTLILIHNTYTNESDINFASKKNENIFWGLCPKANLYIENKLPDINVFFKKKINCTIGTDSLASNNRLSIIDELKTITLYFPNIPLVELLKWSCFNGAKALKLEGLGVFKKGYSPGIIHLKNISDSGELKESTKAERVI